MFDHACLGMSGEGAGFALGGGGLHILGALGAAEAVRDSVRERMAVVTFILATLLIFCQRASVRNDSVRKERR